MAATKICLCDDEAAHLTSKMRKDLALYNHHNDEHTYTTQFSTASGLRGLYHPNIRHMAVRYRRMRSKGRGDRTFRGHWLSRRRPSGSIRCARSTTSHKSRVSNDCSRSARCMCMIRHAVTTSPMPKTRCMSIFDLALLGVCGDG